MTLNQSALTDMTFLLLFLGESSDLVEYLPNPFPSHIHHIHEISIHIVCRKISLVMKMTLS